MSLKEKFVRIAKDRSIKVEEVLERVDYSKLFLLEEDLLEIAQSQEWIEFFQKDSDSFHRLLDDLFSMGLVDSNFPQISQMDAVRFVKNLIQNNQIFGESLSVLTKISQGVESEDDLIWEAVKSLNLDYEMRKKFGLNGRAFEGRTSFAS